MIHFSSIGFCLFFQSSSKPDKEDNDFINSANWSCKFVFEFIFSEDLKGFTWSLLVCIFAQDFFFLFPPLHVKSGAVHIWWHRCLDRPWLSRVKNSWMNDSSLYAISFLHSTQANFTAVNEHDKPNDWSHHLLWDTTPQYTNVEVPQLWHLAHFI